MLLCTKNTLSISLWPLNNYGFLDKIWLKFLLEKKKMEVAFSPVQFSQSVMSDSLRSHGIQHTSHPCPSPTPGVYPNSCLLSQWCHPTISSSVITFYSCPLSFPGSESFQKSQLFASGGQSTGISASISVLPMNTQDWSPLGWTGFKILARVIKSV